MSRGEQHNVVDIIRRLKEVRRFRTDTQLAEYLGLTQQTISTWKKRNTIDYAKVIAKYDDVDLNWLLKGGPERKDWKGDFLIETEQDAASKVEFSKGAILEALESILIKTQSMSAFDEALQADVANHIQPQISNIKLRLTLLVDDAKAAISQVEILKEIVIQTRSPE